MKKNIADILLSILLGISVLLGLSFWLDVKFGFNIFYGEHWDELAKLQASNTPVSITFYISFGVAIFIFLFGLYLIYRQKIRKIFITTYTTPIETPITVQRPAPVPVPEPTPQLVRPPKLHLPKNIGDIAAAKYANNSMHTNTPAPQIDTSKYDSVLSEIFSENGYLVKQNPKISGLNINLFAIGSNENLWIGCVDCDPNRFTAAVEKLNAVFLDTLEDITININAFVLNTLNLYDYGDKVPVFQSVDEIKQFMADNKNPPIDNDTEQDNFDAYSEYIDTIIQYIKNV